MKLTAAIDMYVLHRQATGEKFQGPFVALRAFSRRYRTKTLQAITPAEVKQFLDGQRTGPATWRRKYGTLRDFFAYWRCRGKLNTVPMPPTAPKYMQTFVPYIYSRRELRLLLEAVPRCQQNVGCRISAATLRILLLLLYGTGMRVGEALRLRMVDVDIDNGVITIRGTKSINPDLFLWGEMWFVSLGNILLHREDGINTTSLFSSRGYAGPSDTKS